jgi:hypothetical protein
MYNKSPKTYWLNITITTYLYISWFLWAEYSREAWLSDSESGCLMRYHLELQSFESSTEAIGRTHGCKAGTLTLAACTRLYFLPGRPPHKALCVNTHDIPLDCLRENDLRRQTRCHTQSLLPYSVGQANKRFLLLGRDNTEV